MNISWKSIYSRKGKNGFFSPKLRQESYCLRGMKYFKKPEKQDLEKNDSQRTLIDNRSISDSFNTSILSMNMRSYSYKRAESELRSILKKKGSLKEKIKINKIENSLNKSLRFVMTSKKNVKHDSSLSPEEANLIIDEYRNVHKPKIWNSILANYKANPQHLMNLIPISLRYKKSHTPCGRTLKKFSFSPESKDKFQSPSRNKLVSPINAPTKNYPISSTPSTPEVVETLKENPDIITDDWSKSLLHYNLKNKIQSSDIHTISQKQLETIIRKIPSDEIELDKLRNICLKTLEILLMELLGTHQDFIKFKSSYSNLLPSVVRNLISNCLNLFELRKETSDIIDKAMKRERMIRKISNASKDDIIMIYKISKEIRDKIKAWLKHESVPFNKFVFKGKDYLIKMNEDLMGIQKAMFKYK
ncbi:hypothetical protein SteCoe_23863 [Stentor coeruleus]|uniref:Uncharacterized protein n=1 Tax=Stentor coeruleus TaxID=5963 RepID=A0A1R2BIV3_9CILI|nr:hypothetical protein SteCoe_23863 [Stentor coeruleus]